MSEIQHPTRAGQAVTHTTGGCVGITTDAPRKRSGQIGVMWLAGSYSVLERPEDLTVIPSDVMQAVVDRRSTW
jgi:hypothetical protein